MEPERSTTAPLYIPQEVLDAYLPEARRLVERSRPVRTWAPLSAPAARTGAPLSASAARAAAQLARELRLVRLASFSAVGLWGALVVAWSWFAVHTGSVVWTTIALAGALALVCSLVALGRLAPAPPQVRRPRAAGSRSS